MTQFEQEQAAKKFAEIWKEKGLEKQEAQKFLIQLLREVYGVENSEQYIDFELPVKLENTSFADGYIEATHTLIEMKGKDIDLNKPEKQSDGTTLTPYQQAKRYSDNLGYSKRARWIIVSNFRQIEIHDMENTHSEPTVIELENLYKEYYMLNILIDSEDENIKKEKELSVDAGVIVGQIYKALYNEYKKIESDETKFASSINALCVRLVFCLYAEDAGLFGKHNMFHDYLIKYPANEIRTALINLFNILDTKPEDRNRYEKEELLAFPYVNGGLFADESIEIPQITEEIKNILLIDASENFNWSEISPTIFGGVFESTLNPETRRKGGMHYTSVKDIHKVIDPLFLDELSYELDMIIAEPVLKTRKKKLLDFQNKIANLKFFDPACGSGNFLTETYLSLRKLENKMLEEYYDQQTQFLSIDITPIKVSIGQFYGIEINDFAVTVAKTALWIAESQMFKITQEIIRNDKNEFLPLKSYSQIVQGNSLTIDWEDIVKKHELNYIIGNPPFVGSSRTDNKNEQKKDMELVLGEIKGYGKLDYVSCWYVKASKYIKNTNIRCAFVSTNSITQGEQVALLWRFMFEKNNMEIIYAYRSFKWENDSINSAGVVCVIIGFREKKNDNIEKFIFDSERRKIKANHINGYLHDKNDLYIKSRTESFNKDMPKIIQGNKPWDDGNLILSEEEMIELISKYPITKEYIKPFIGGNELIKNKKRYCLWLKDVNPNLYINIPEIMERLKRVEETRKSTKTVAVQKEAETPMLFSQIRQPNEDYLAIPEVSSDSRKYIPMAFLSKNDISSNKIFMIPGASLFLFGVLISNVHMSWMRTVTGRLGTGYSYSPSVYNNFPFPKVSQKQKETIENTAIKILEARKLYSNNSLAELYDEEKMKYFPELYKAHKNNDAAVMNAYGFDWKQMSEDDCVAELMKMYQKLTENQK